MVIILPKSIKYHLGESGLTALFAITNPSADAFVPGEIAMGCYFREAGLLQ